MTYSVFLAPITGASPQKSNSLNPFPYLRSFYFLAIDTSIQFSLATEPSIFSIAWYFCPDPSNILQLEPLTPPAEIFIPRIDENLQFNTSGLTKISPTVMPPDVSNS